MREDVQSYVIEAGLAGQHAGIGGKAKSLAALHGLGYPVPRWVAVSVQAFYDSLPVDVLQKFQQAATPEDIAEMLQSLSPGEALKRELEKALKSLSPKGERLAIRSSALEEDGIEQSYAGLLESFLYVKPDEVLARIQDVWRSAFQPGVLAYRAKHQLSILPQAPAVIIQQMVDSDVSGVAFGADPVTGDRHKIIISSLYGLGTALVSGAQNADTFELNNRLKCLTSQLAEKKASELFDASQNRIVTLPNDPNNVHQPSLSQGQLKQIGKLVQRLNRQFDRPQDVEWAIAKNRLYLLQSRPITTLAEKPSINLEGLTINWMQSGLTNYWPGMVSPFTYSFFSRVYQRSYALEMQEPVVEKRLDLEDHLSSYVGLVRGRLFENCRSRLFALNHQNCSDDVFPLMNLNLEYLKRERSLKRLMKNCKNGLEGFFIKHFHPAYVLYHARLTRNRLLNAIRMNEKVLESLPDDLMPFNALQLVSLLKLVEKTLVCNWSCADENANSVFALEMLVSGFFSVQDPEALRRFIEELKLDHLQKFPHLAVAEMNHLANLLAHQTQLITLCCEADLAVIYQNLNQDPQLASEVYGYLGRHAIRCLEDFKPETPTLWENPLPFFRALGNLSRATKGLVSESEAAKTRDILVHFAEKNYLSLKTPLRQYLFKRANRALQQSLWNKERLHMTQALLVARLRFILIQLGWQFQKFQFLDHYEDIFYLEVDEVIGMVEGRATCRNLKGLVNVRKAEYETYKNMPAPISNIHMSNIADFSCEQLDEQRDAAQLHVDEFKGQGCFPGIVVGRARLLPNNIGTQVGELKIEPNDIVIVEQADPGFMLLLSSAAALLMENGSILSHSAILARELKIPTIVGVSGIQQWLADGDWIEINGSSGTVRKLKSKDSASVLDNRQAL